MFEDRIRDTSTLHVSWARPWSTRIVDIEILLAIAGARGRAGMILQKRSVPRTQVGWLGIPRPYDHGCTKCHKSQADSPIIKYFLRI